MASESMDASHGHFHIWTEVSWAKCDSNEGLEIFLEPLEVTAAGVSGSRILNENRKTVSKVALA